MNPSEMTNERIAEELIATIPHLSDEAWSCTDADEILREAAARLRKSDITIVAQKAKAAAEGYAYGLEEVADLRRRLKVAEDALEKIDNMCDGDMCKFFDNTHHCSACRYLDECQTGVAHAALHEIRKEGGAK